MSRRPPIRKPQPRRRHGARSPRPTQRDAERTQSSGVRGARDAPADHAVDVPLQRQDGRRRPNRREEHLGRSLAREPHRLLEHRRPTGQIVREHTVTLGQHARVARRPHPIEVLHKLAVNLLGPVPGVEQQIQSAELPPTLEVPLHRGLPRRDLVVTCKRKAVPRHVDHSGHPGPQRVKVQRLRLPRSVRHSARRRPRQRIQE
mmetsp:Transcript_14791/g.43794  ORF Transcript_14791/g.43794 Transcript_14791/m.43794 type:complete len:203 (-) Transcript_14791:249-857(-)